MHQKVWRLDNCKSESKTHTAALAQTKQTRNNQKHATHEDTVNNPNKSKITIVMQKL